jgi:Mg2+/Co2+ transporter CorB
MSSDVFSALLAVIFLIIVSAFLSSAESGLTRASRSRLAEVEKRGSKRARIALELIDVPERLIGALFLGKSLANIMAVAVATAVVAKLFGSASAIVAAIAMTLVILIVAEVAPKMLAVSYPERTALIVAPFARGITAMLGPIVLAIEALVRAVLNLFGASVDDTKGVLSAHDKLRGAIDLHVKEETLVKKDRDMLGGILDLKDLEVADVMIHRIKMDLLDASLPMKEIVNEMMEGAHTRVPLWRDKPDNIIGILHARTLFAALQKAGGDAGKVNLDDVMSEPWFVPDTRPLEDQLNAFLRRKTHFALVVDEYGEVQGLVTLEDILEEIVGDIKDEFDDGASGIRKARDGSFVIDGATPLRDMNRKLDLELPDNEATTLAGLVIHEARMIPDAGQVFSFHGYKFEVLKKRKQQITSIRVTALPKIEPVDNSG